MNCATCTNYNGTKFTLTFQHIQFMNEKLKTYPLNHFQIAQQVCGTKKS